MATDGSIDLGTQITLNNPSGEGREGRLWGWGAVCVRFMVWGGVVQVGWTEPSIPSPPPHPTPEFQPQQSKTSPIMTVRT